MDGAGGRGGGVRGGGQGAAGIRNIISIFHEAFETVAQALATTVGNNNKSNSGRKTKTLFRDRHGYLHAARTPTTAARSIHVEAKAAAETKGDGARWEEEEEEDGGAASRRGTGIVVGIHGQGSPPPPPPFSGLARRPRLGGWAGSRGVKLVTSSVKQRPARVVLVKKN